MNHLDSLTTQEKIMNMAKLGTVSAAGNYFHSLGKRHKQRAGGLMRYTLCVFDKVSRRNGSRYGFAFDIPAISGQTTPARCPASSIGKIGQSSSIGKIGQSGFVVIPGLWLMGEHNKTTLKTSASLTACRFPQFSPQKITVPPLPSRFNGFAGHFPPILAMSSRLWKIPPRRWRGLRPPQGFSHRLQVGGCHE